MASSVQIPVTQTGLEASVQAALKSVGKNAQINLGTNARQINALAQPLGRITGQADEFTKSMEAANARVFAFGASVGIINNISKAFGALVKNTIAVEKSLVEINSVLGKSSSELDKFGSDLFKIAKNTGQSFEAVSKGALELARQGLKPAETLERLNDALILTRLSGLGAEKSVEGLTAAVNSFKSTGITTSEVLNKLVNVSQKYAVSEKDLIEGLKRSSSVAKQAGVSFDELVGVITAVQEKSAVGGAVIGTSFKTIFSRLQKRDTLDALQQLGVEVTDVQGKILPATRLLENLAVKIKSLDQIQIAQITEKVGGGYQIDKLISALDDMGSKGSIAFDATKISAESANQAYAKNAALNKTLANLINQTTLSAQELGATLGKLGITDSAKNLLGFFNNLLESIQKILGEESALGDVFRGLAKGIGNLVTGPGLALFGAIILKLSKDLAQFGFASLKSFFGIGKAAKEVETLEKSINQALTSNVRLQQQLFNLEGNRAAQIQLMAQAVVQQETAMRRMASISSSLTGPLYQAGIRGTSAGLRTSPPRAAGGYMPAVAKESSDINRGVGGAKSGDRPVVIPNFNFGGGRKGSMVAHTGEYAVPNFAGSGGTAIFNRDMVRSMGLPSGAKKINAAGGLIPNFAKVSDVTRYFASTLASQVNKSQSSDGRLSPDDSVNLIGNRYKKLYVPIGKGESKKAYEDRIIKHFGYSTAGMARDDQSAVDGYKSPTSLLEVKGGKFDKSDTKIKFLRANIENYNKNNPLDSVWTKNKDNVKVDGLLVHSNKKDAENSSIPNIFIKDLIQSDKYRANKQQKSRKLDNTGKYIQNLASGFIPNFAARPNASADTIRAAIDEGIEGYRRPGLNEYGQPFKTYWFPDGSQASQGQVEKALKHNPSVASAKKKEDATKRQKKIDEKGVMDFTIDANTLGGIALVTPARGGSSGTLSAQSLMQNLPKKPEGFLMDDKLIINNIQSTGVPTQKDFEQISSEINKRFAGPIVDLAQSLYGKLYSGASGSEFASQLGQLRSTSKGGILPPGAEGQIFEAAGKAALTSMNQIASAFDPSKENRPFDFTNAASMKEMLGVKAVRGDAKRAGGSNRQFQETVNGLIKKSINDESLRPKIFSQIKQQASGRKLAENAAGGYVPNFADPLKEAIGREIAAGVPASQIYIDKNQSLKSAANPMGLMVANRRDEPAGGHQGISRAIREGRDPKTYGAARGFMPNYAPQIGEVVRADVGKTRISDIAINDFNSALKQISDQLRKGSMSFADVDAEIRKLAVASGASKGAQQKLRTVGESLVSAYNNELIARNEKAKELKQQRANDRIKEAPSKGGSDMLGTIFAVQGAMTALTGATEGATNGFAKFTNSFASSLGTIATTVFAVQGISQAIGKEGTKLGAAIKGVGTGLIGLTVALQGVSLFYSTLKNIRNDYQKSSEALAVFNDTALKFADYLENSEIFKTQSTNTAKNITKDAEYEFYKSKGFNVTGAALDKLSGDQLSGRDDVLQYVDRIRKSGLMSDEELKAAITNIKEVSGNNAELASAKLAEIAANLTEQSNFIFKDTENFFKKERTPQEREDFTKKYERAGISQKTITGYVEAFERKRNEQAEDKLRIESETVEQINISIAQDKLRNSIAEAIANSRRFENDLLNQSLLRARELGNLDEKGLRELEDKIALRDIDRKLEDEAVSLIQSQIDKAKDIVAKKEEAVKLEEKLNSLTPEQLRNSQDVLNILNETNQLLSQGANLSNAEIDAAKDKLANLLKNYDLDKKSLIANQATTEEYKEQNRQLNLISQASRRVLEAQSFSREIGTTRSVNANDLRVSALESSKLGASDSQIRQIDKQIAAINANTVALEQSLAREKIFDDMKKELSENNKITDENTKVQVDNQIKEAKTIDQLEGLASLIFMSRGGIDQASNISAMNDFFQKYRQDLERQGEADKQANAKASADLLNTGRISPVVSALEMFRRSLLETSQIIDQKIQDLELEKLTSISGRRNAEIAYEIETLNQQKGQSPEEAARIARDRQNKPLTQLLSEAFSTTEQERSMNLKNSIVDASVQFKNNMIDGISEAIEGGKSLGDVLQSSAYEFVKAINKQLMSNAVDSLVGAGKQASSGGSGFLGNIMSSIGFASGGMISGGSGTKDDVPAMLMGGEYVINKKSVQKYGPQFLEALNKGTIGGYAKGGRVQSGKGGFFTPGTYGLGGIEGTGNLLKFATQAYTSGSRDSIINAGNYASIALEPESVRLTNFGRMNSPQAAATRAAKEQAFGLYSQEMQAQAEAKKQAEAEKDAFKKQLIMLGISVVGGAVMKAGSAGFSNAIRSGGSLTEAFKGVWSGSGDFGGLKNLFSGNFAESQVGSNKELAEYIFNNSDLDAREALEYASQLTGEPLEYKTPSSSFNPVGTGPFDAQGNYIEAWADDPSKWRKQATGGTIPSMGGVDTIPAMLSGGEFIMNRSAAQNIGAGNLQALNAGAGSIVTEEKTEELNDKLIAKLDELIEASGGSGGITINVEGSTGTASEEKSGNPSDQKQQLARQIRDAVLKVIQEEKRLGGSLRR